MENITNKNVNSFCRSCLSKLEDNSSKSSKFNIHELPKVAQLWTYCTETTHFEKDGLPQFFCKQCYEKFQEFDDLRDRCLRSYHILVSCLNSTSYGMKTRSSLKNAPFTKLVKSPKHTDRSLKKQCVDTEKINSISEERMLTLPESQENDEYMLEDFKTKDEESPLNEVAITMMSCTGDIETNDQEFSSITAKPSINEAKKREPDGQTTEVFCRKNTQLKFLCSHCPKRCTSQENLNAHIRTHQGLKPFQCPHCERSFNKSYNLKMHIRDEHIEKNDIICSIQGCNKHFKREGSFKMHLRLKHSEKKPVLKTFICEDCGCTFKNMTRLKEHRYKHVPVEEYPFQCELCGKRYTSQRTYKDHLLRHSGIKNFECPYCGLKKTTRNELRTHINYHTKERQWKCPHCPSVFNNSANLGMHDRIVHKGIRRYTCSYCDLSFGKADTLKHHEMRHTGEKPHECHLCHKRFIQAVALRTHLKTHYKAAKKNALSETSSPDIKSDSTTT